MGPNTTGHNVKWLVLQAVEDVGPVHGWWVKFVCQRVLHAVVAAGNRHGPFVDGGVVDRIALKAWRDRRRSQLSKTGESGLQPPPCLVHVIKRSTPWSGNDDALGTGEPHIKLLHSPKSGVNFFDLGDFAQQMETASLRAQPALQEVRAAADMQQAAAPAPAKRQQFAY